MDRAGTITPEGVVLDLDTAGVVPRMAAALIDLAIQGAILVGVWFAAAATTADGAGSTAIAVLVVVFFFVLFGYPVAFETLWRGRTPGKAALGLRVVTTDGGPVRMRHAAIRAALGFVDFWLTSGAGAVLSVLFTRSDQRLGDLAAGTVVLKERMRTAVAPMRFSVPPGWEPFAATLDTSGLTADQYATVRSYLLRATALAPDARAPLARRLMASLEPTLGRAMPPDADPEAVLRCIAARHQARGRPVG